MTLRELFPNWAETNNGLFSHILEDVIYNIGGSDWAWFDEEFAADADEEYIDSINGEQRPLLYVKRVVEKFDNESDALTRLAFEFFARYGDAILRYAKMRTYKYNPIENYDMTEHTEDKTDGSVTTNSHADTTDKRTGFNTVDPVITGTTHGEGGGKNVTDNKWVHDHNRHGNIGTMTAVDLLTKERGFWVTFDIIKQLYAYADEFLTNGVM